MLVVAYFKSLSQRSCGGTDELADFRHRYLQNRSQKLHRLNQLANFNDS